MKQKTMTQEEFQKKILKILRRIEKKLNKIEDYLIAEEDNEEVEEEEYITTEYNGSNDKRNKIGTKSKEIYPQGYISFKNN